MLVQPRSQPRKASSDPAEPLCADASVVGEEAERRSGAAEAALGGAGDCRLEALEEVEEGARAFARPATLLPRCARSGERVDKERLQRLEGCLRAGVR